LNRSVAIELKTKPFKANYKAQMDVYLKWLNLNDRRPHENVPIGLILCPSAKRELIELLELDKSGIAVSEFWTVVPPKKEFEERIQQITSEAKERLERRKLLGTSTVPRIAAPSVDLKDDESEDDD